MYSDETIKRDWARLIAGETIVVNEEWHDAAIAYFNRNDGPDADQFFRELATAPNPKRCGVRDGFIAYLKIQ